MQIWQVAVLYTLAFVAGTMSAWAVMSLGVTHMFEGGPDGLAGTLILPVLAAICVFSLVYGLGSGRMLKSWFWFVVPAAILAFVYLMMLMTMRGFLSLLAAGAVALGIVFVAGLLAALRRDAVRGISTDDR